MFLSSLWPSSIAKCLSLGSRVASLDAQVHEAAKVPLLVLDAVDVQEVLLAVDGVEVVPESAHCEVGVVAELGVAHELRLWQLGHAGDVLALSGLSLLWALGRLGGEHLGKFDEVRVVALAAEYDDVELSDLCTGSWLVQDEVGAGNQNGLPLGLLQRSSVALPKVDVLD